MPMPFDLAAAQTYYSAIRGPRGGAWARRPTRVRILPGFTPYVGRTEAEARAKYDEMRRLIHPKVGLGILFNVFGDLSAYPIDGPVPEPEGDIQVRSIGNALLEKARPREADHPRPV